MADPLSLLREYVSGNKIDEVVVNGDRVDFGGKFTFSKNTPTGYKSQQGKGNFYDLGTLLFFARNISVKFTEYFKKAREETGTAVTFVDRKDLQEYLTGRSDRSEYIQLAVLPPLEVGHPAKRARLEAGGEAGSAGPSYAAGAEEEAEEAAEMAALRKVRENELQLRDRNTMLSVPGRSFRKVLTILSQAQRDNQRAYPERSERRPAPKPVVPVRPSGRYERQTQQDATLRQMGAAELGVQVGFKPAPAAPAAPADGVPPPPPPPAQQGAAPPPPPPPTGPAPGHQQRHGGSSGRHAAAQQQARRPAPAAKRPAAPQQRGTPVIMVPPGMTALLNMHNVRSFLERGEFQTTDQAKAAAAEANDGKPVAKEERMTIQRTVGRKQPVKYYVMDKEPTNKQDWERVVAVICLGKAWQFKKWPFKGAERGDLVDTFSKVLGGFVHYTDEKVDATVKSWNVKILGLNRQSRHRDATVAQEFWRLLDAHLQARSSTLLY